MRYYNLVSIQLINYSVYFGTITVYVMSLYSVYRDTVLLYSVYCEIVIYHTMTSYIE